MSKFTIEEIIKRSSNSEEFLSPFRNMEDYFCLEKICYFSGDDDYSVKKLSIIECDSAHTIKTNDVDYCKMPFRNRSNQGGVILKFRYETNYGYWYMVLNFHKGGMFISEILEEVES